MRIASDRSYGFGLAPAELWEAFTQVDEYRRWWPWLHQLDGASFEVGSVWECSVRPPLPYTVRFTLMVQEVCAPSLAVASIAGDVVGSARLEITDAAGGSRARLLSELAPHNGVLQAVALVARPVARFGHDWVLDHGARQFSEAVGTKVDP